MPPYCAFHPDRYAVGICVLCRQTICPECATRQEGVNHCHECLGKLAALPVTPKAAPRALQWTVLLAAWFALLWIAWLVQGSLVP